LIAGVCGGLAEWLGWPPWLVRLAFVVGSLVPILPGFLVYLLLWVAVPAEKPALQRGS
jgi:phage shock protein PspC (stress-responsive transcriptional regulator)